MANPEHVKIVRQGAEAIRAFRESNPDVQLDLSEADLRDAFLMGFNLSGVNLRKADLSSANLGGANLAGAKLIAAKLIGCELRYAKLNNADLQFANLSGALVSNVNLSDSNLSEAILRGANLNHAQLRTANLSDADLSYTILSNSYMFGADLTRADLSHADMSFADLNTANLSSASLGYANLKNSNLSNAELAGATLGHADLNNANLSNANLSYASVDATVFGNIDMRYTKGLDSVRHYGPAIIGVDTLFLSNGEIPPVFLRGCGVPEDLITYLPSFVGSALTYYSCFISHNKADKLFARQLHDRLQGRGIRCWLDEKQLNPGDDLYHEIDRGVRVWDKVLLCASKDSLASSWVDDEITIALEKEKELLKTTQQRLLKIIPLDLDGFMFTDGWQSGYRAQIRKRVAADFTKWKTDADEFERQFERVVKALRTDGGKLPEPQSKLK